MLNMKCKNIGVMLACPLLALLQCQPIWYKTTIMTGGEVMIYSCPRTHIIIILHMYLNNVICIMPVGLCTILLCSEKRKTDLIVFLFLFFFRT